MQYVEYDIILIQLYAQLVYNLLYCQDFMRKSLKWPPHYYVKYIKLSLHKNKTQEEVSCVYINNDLINCLINKVKIKYQLNMIQI